MKLLKLRVGSATNSSSTHSIIWWRGGQKPRGVAPETPGGYGWDDFTLVSRAGKAAYIEAMRHSLGLRNGDDDVNGPYVDHQSVWSLPVDVRTGEKSVAAFEALAKLIIEEDDLVILGGNDNSDGHPLRDRGDPFAIALRHGALRSRFDPSGIWTVMTGEYFYGIRSPRRYRFGESEATKATTPELVDLKITNRCSSGCSHCYQNSTPSGQHASPGALARAAEVLATLGVMEVAIGGGEPTENPDLGTFVEMLRQRRIVANVTTRDAKWAEKSAHGKGLRVDGIGLSISAGFSDFVWGAQHHVVLGTLTREEFIGLLRSGKDHSFLLLAYKPVGRGALRTPIPYDWWLDEVSALVKSGWEGSIGIDTPLAGADVSGLRREGVDVRLYETEEGKFSAYWDLVSGEIAPSSYGGERHALDTSRPAEDFQETFAKW
jgi:hypothetical protein